MQPLAERATPLSLHGHTPALLALILGLLLAAFASPRPAHSECTLNGSTVTCPSDADNDTGYSAGTDEGLSVNIQEGASVTNSDAAADVISLNGGNRIDNRGTLTASGTQSALVAKDANEVQNQLTGTIESNGAAPTIDFTGNDSATDTGNTVINLGRIQNAGSGPALRFQMPVDPNWNVFENRFTNLEEPVPQISSNGTWAILGSEGIDWIVNQGNIGDPDIDVSVQKTGSISLGGGNDILDNQISGADTEDEVFGEIFGDIDMGAGEDQVFNGGTLWGDVDLGDDTDLFGNVFDPTGSLEMGNTGTLHGTVRLGGTSTLDPDATEEEIEANRNRFSNAGIVGESLPSIFDTAIAGGDGRDAVLNAAPGIVKGSISLGAGIDTFENAGQVDGNIDLGAGDDRFIWNDGSLMGTASGGTGTDQFILRNLGVLSEVDIDLATFTASGFNGFEELVFGLDSDWVGITTREGEQVDFLLSGWFNLSGSLPTGTFGGVRFDNGTMRFDQAVLSTPVTAGPNSQFFFFVEGRDGNPATPDSDHLQLNTNLEIEEGAVFVVGLDEELTSLTALRPGQTDSYTLIDYGSRSGTDFEFLTWEEYAVFDMALRYDDSGNQIIVDLTRFTFEQTAETENQARVASYLDDTFVSPDTNPDFLSAMTPLDYLNTEDIQLAFDQLSPESYDAQTMAALSGGRMLSRALLEGPVQCRTRTHETLNNRLTSNAFCGRSEWDPFQILFAGTESRSGDSIEFDNSTNGLIAGASRRFGDQFALAFAIGASRTSIETVDLGSGDALLAMVGLATAWDLGAFQLKSALGYTHGWHDTERAISFDASKPDAQYQSDQLVAEIEASYGFETGGWDLRPLASVDAAYLIEESLSETETSEFSLDVKQRDNQVVGGSLGIRLSKPYPRYRFRVTSSMSDGIWTPEFVLRGRGVITGNEHAIEATMRGVPGSIGTLDLIAEDSRYAAEFGAGLTFQPRDQKNTFGVSYNGLLGDKSTAHRFQANFHLPLDQKFLIGKIEPLLFKGPGLLARGAHF